LSNVESGNSLVEALRLPGGSYLNWDPRSKRMPRNPF